MIWALAICCVYLPIVMLRMASLGCGRFLSEPTEHRTVGHGLLWPLFVLAFLVRAIKVAIRDLRDMP